MPKTDVAGLDFKEAARQAAAELAQAEAIEEPASSPAEPVVVSQDEQPAVEINEGEEGLFTTLQPEQTEQPNMDSVTVEVNGEQKTISELRDGYMMQADYTHKTQELARERAELSKAKTLWDALQENPVENARKLYQRVASGDQVFDEQTVAPKTDTSDIESLIEAKVQERLASDPRLQAIESETALAEVNAVLKDIEKDYNVELTVDDKRAVMERAIKENISNLHAVFALMWQEREKLLKAADNAHTVSTSTGRRSDPIDAQPEENQHFDSFREAFDLVVREEGATALFE